MPTPQGSWANAHAQRQSKYNMHLLGGLWFAGLTLFTVCLITYCFKCATTLMCYLLLLQGYQTGAFFLNLGPELTKTEINVVTHQQVREKPSEPEPEDVPPVEIMEITPEPVAAEPVVAEPPAEVSAEADEPQQGEAPPPAAQVQAEGEISTAEHVIAEAVTEAVVEAIAEAAVEVAAEVVAAVEVVETAEAAAEPVVETPPPVAEPVVEGESEPLAAKEEA